MLKHLWGFEHAQDRLRFHIVDALFKCYRERDNWNPDGSSRALLVKEGRRHLLLYSEMGKLYPDRLRYRCYPKHHQFQHLVEENSVNPKLEWCYSDESEIGAAAKESRYCN